MIPIRLNTKYGHEQFEILRRQFAHYKKENQISAFKARCLEDYRKQEKYLEYFLDDDTMSSLYKMGEEDIDDFDIFNEQSDICSCLLYFSSPRVGNQSA